MKPGDAVRIRKGFIAGANCVGKIIRESAHPDFDWTVEVYFRYFALEMDYNESDLTQV